MNPIIYAKTAVITRTKNRPIFLKRAIESVLSQAERDFVHVIVNDGGDREPVDSLLEGFKDRYENRLLLIHNEKSLGMEAASNVGIRSSDSMYVVIHDDDDSWHPNFLGKMTSYLESNDVIRNLGGVVCYTTEISEQITDDQIKEVARRSIASWIKDISLWRMCADNYFAPISFLYKREVYDKIGGLYREDIPVQGDWEFNLRFMQQYEIGLLKEHLAFYYIRISNDKSGEAYSNSVNNMEKHSFYKTYLRNEFLRKELAEGKLGVGYMMNVNPIILRVDRAAHGLIRIWEKLKYPFVFLKALRLKALT
ncbi:MAG: glycosyltransferase [Methylobacter sp.]|uniref:glycosyltransferase family 2 protein n=1 Tax=Methylobacter sp. TaxID=2051955 RepID=UPI0025F71106|nr:glycosyltransferase [Methylobacter sp.]MCK9620199.1 glycosyltransferase [Methylobacter sp.]